jgi:hypothetical protein
MTALRAMTILEFAEKKRSTGGAIKQAKREIRNEHRVKKEAKLAAAVEAAGYGDDGLEPSDVSTGQEAGANLMD